MELLIAPTNSSFLNSYYIMAAKGIQASHTHLNNPVTQEGWQFGINHSASPLFLFSTHLNQIKNGGYQ